MNAFMQTVRGVIHSNGSVAIGVGVYRAPSVVGLTTLSARLPRAALILVNPVYVSSTVDPSGVRPVSRRDVESYGKERVRGTRGARRWRVLRRGGALARASGGKVGRLVEEAVHREKFPPELFCRHMLHSVSFQCGFGTHRVCT